MFLGRVVKDGEPYWTETDRQWSLALLAEERGTHSCGQPIEESFAPENDGKYVWEAVLCHACAAAQREARTFDENSEGLYVSARKI